MNAFLIAGTHSGVGKTSTALVLLTRLKAMGLEVQPFKAGPDYIDPAYHDKVVAGRHSRNLDTWLLTDATVRSTFLNHARSSDVAVVEGVMGLFDGRTGSGASGSSAELAKLLDLPVILVIDASGLAQSAGALALGFERYDPSLRVAGVLFNRCHGEQHYEYLKKGLEQGTHLQAFGFIPPHPDLTIPERHLGLKSVLEFDWGPPFKRALLEASRFVDVNRLLAKTVCSLPAPQKIRESQPAGQTRIGVAFDEAFSFYYHDNFDLLRDAGADLVFFSPIRDATLPEGVQALYLGGGFPELFAQALAANRSMIDSVRSFCARGGVVYAECGGLMYLAQNLTDLEGNQVPLVGAIPGSVRMTRQLQCFGYHELEASADTFLFAKGDALKCHEFHYSVWDEDGRRNPPYVCEGKPRGAASDTLIASYQHLHFGSDPMLAQRFVRAACGAGRFVTAQEGS